MSKILIATALLTLAISAIACDSRDCPFQLWNPNQDVKALDTTGNPGPRKQPEPTEPLVSGAVTGLKADDLVIIHCYMDNGWQNAFATRQHNGTWQIIITNPGDSEYYTITAEAKGYTVKPSNYRIRIVGQSACVIRNAATTEEALHLDFQFSLEAFAPASPTD